MLACTLAPAREPVIGDTASIEYGQQGIYRGRQRIAAFLAAVAKAVPGELRETPVMQPVIHVAADGLSARARWRSLVMGGAHGQDGRWQEGLYENQYAKEDGVWKIAQLHWYTTVNGGDSIRRYFLGLTSGRQGLRQGELSIQSQLSPVITVAPDADRFYVMTQAFSGTVGTNLASVRSRA